MSEVEAIPCGVENPSEVYSGTWWGDVRLSSKASRVFENYRLSALSHGGVVRSDITYEGAGVIRDKAEACARTILANECPLYIFTTREVNGDSTHNRLISRAQYENFSDRYTIITG